MICKKEDFLCKDLLENGLLTIGYYALYLVTVSIVNKAADALSAVLHHLVVRCVPIWAEKSHCNSIAFISINDKWPPAVFICSVLISITTKQRAGGGE